MKTFVRIGLVAALCMAGTAAYSQEPVKKDQKIKVHTGQQSARTTSTSKPAPAPTTSKPTAAPAKKATVPATRAKKVEPAKKIDFAPTK